MLFRIAFSPYWSGSEPETENGVGGVEVASGFNLAHLPDGSQAPHQAHDPEGTAEPRPSPGQAELSAQSDTYRTIAETLETGKAQVIDVFDGKIVLRKPIDEKESNGNGTAKPKKAKAGT